MHDDKAISLEQGEGRFAFNNLTAIFTRNGANTIELVCASMYHIHYKIDCVEI